jgi:site-specific recombinase XerD
LTPPEEKIKALSHGALVSLLVAIPRQTIIHKRDRAVVALMAIHGLRRIECHRLDHEHLNRLGDDATLLVHGKGNKLRTIYLREDTLAVIGDYIHAKMLAGFPLSGALLLAHGNATRGARFSRRALNHIVDQYLSAASLKRAGVSCHALRHTHGTLAVSGGAKIEHLQKEMGHTHIDTTGIYVRAVDRAKNNPATFIDVEV